MSFRIIGIGSSVPEYVLTNDELSTMVETSDEWISTRTGIKERHICTKETLLDLASESSVKALEEAELGADKLDYIICATLQGDYVTPSLACCVQEKIGATCPAFDINGACSGFVYALDTAAALFDSGRAENILVVAAEKLSKFVDYTDRSTCVLFGDGAGAVVLTKGENLLSMKLTAMGNAPILNIGGTSSANNPFDKCEKLSPYLFMAGQEVYKFAVNSMCNDIKDVAADAGIELSDIDFVIPHQANIRIVNTAKNRLGLRDDQVVISVGQYGNTSSSSIPLAIDAVKKDGRLKHGDIIALTAFGGGLTTGACIIRY